MSTPTTRFDERTKRTDEQVPASLSRARTVAHLLDESVRIPGTGFRFGLDPVFGLVPVLGDSVALVGSLYIVLTGVVLGVPWRVTAVMLCLAGLDWFLGSVPVLGTPVDAVLKVNKRNVAILERHVGINQQPRGQEP